jgi:hypothetical protein
MLIVKNRHNFGLEVDHYCRYPGREGGEGSEFRSLCPCRTFYCVEAAQEFIFLYILYIPYVPECLNFFHISLCLHFLGSAHPLSRISNRPPLIRTIKIQGVNVM